MLMRALGTTLVLIAGCLPLLAQPKTLEAEAKEMEAAYRSAVMQNDSAFFAEHIAPNYLGTLSDGSALDAAALMKGRREKAFQVKTYDIMNQVIKVSGNTAIISECVVTDFAAYGVQQGRNIQVLRVWQKVGSKWNVLALQMTNRANPCTASR